MILHHHPFLAPCRFVRLMLDEHAVRTELVTELYWQERPEFVAVNPGLTLPMAYLGDKGPIIGAVPLMEFIDERFGEGRAGHRMMPNEPFHRAEVRRLVQWFVDKFEHEVSGPFVMERLLKVEMPSSAGGGAPDSMVLRVARQNVKSHLHYLGELAASRAWLAGDTFTFADVAAAAALSSVDYLGEVPWNSDPAAKAWYQKIKSRPAFRPLLKDKARLVPPAPHYDDLDF